MPWVFGWSSGESTGLGRLAHAPAPALRWTTNDVSLIELSFQVNVSRVLLPLPVTTQVNPSAASGGRATETGRIMSISSWLRMWQW